ncbi:MAG: oligopeptide transporter, OPT family [Verrucomicrobia bacterium]|nr:oligopeptide transporter, OPT family [Verrucomicrobiota bacterium]
MSRTQRTTPRAYPELTLTSVIVGYLIGAVITISIGYAALILGFSLEGSELAAILGYGILRGILGRTSIIENNISQTIASAVNGASAGMMFSIPALFILNYTDFNPALMIFACIAGGFLGIAFIIPLRKQMIDFERLTYPGGVAVATILKSPGAGLRKAKLLLAGGAISGLVHLISQYMSRIEGVEQFENFDLGALIGMPAYMNGVWFISLLTVGTGFIAGRGGLCFVIGGYVCYWVLAPVLASMNLVPAPGTVESVPETLRLTVFRPVGIGMLIGGAIAGIALALPLITSAVRSMQSAAKSRSALSKDEMPIQFLYAGIIGAFIMLCWVAIQSVEQIGFARGALMALLGTLWIWIAGVILAECIGRTNWSPLSGMTLIGVTILIIVASGLEEQKAVIAAVTVGAATCVAMAQATDLMMDLKTGYLVGASPRKQQTGQFLATWLGPLLIMALIYVLHEAYKLGSDKLPAPQGQALASMIEGILGGDVPAHKYIAGAGLGALLSFTGVGGLGIQVGLGFYLPFSIVLTYTIGAVGREISDAAKGRRFSEAYGIPVAAGLIVGEALVGVGFALYMIFKGAAGP